MVRVDKSQSFWKGVGALRKSLNRFYLNTMP
jgi:hypothetical protein